MKDEILQLRAQGKTYSEIEVILGCSRGVISYHCNAHVRERAAECQRARRAGTPLERIKPIVGDKYCLHCGVKIESEAVRKYCSHKCQWEYDFKRRLVEWEAGTLKPTNRWLCKALTYLRGYRCAVCGVSDWNEKEIVLEVEHIDGNSDNNEPTNVCLICPNCHSQTETYKGANKGNGRHKRRQRYQEGKSY